MNSGKIVSLERGELEKKDHIRYQIIKLDSSAILPKICIPTSPLPDQKKQYIDLGDPLGTIIVRPFPLLLDWLERLLYSLVPKSRSRALLKDYPSNETTDTATAIPTSGMGMPLWDWD